jgi:hypothetical protein
MRRRAQGVFQLVLLILFVIVLVRFFPLAVRVVEGAALGIRQFWWVVLGFALGGWLVWVLRKRNSG